MVISTKGVCYLGNQTMLYILQKRIDSDLRPLYAAQSDKERYLVMLTELYSR